MEGRLLFTSSTPDWLALPWELLPGRDGTFLVADGRIGIRRGTGAPTASASPLVPLPLRVLFVASAPTNLDGLDYEREEEAMLRISERLGDRVHLDVAEAGTFEELRDLIAKFQPHVVHLSGHGRLQDGIGHFAFEDERGLSDPRDGTELAERLLAGRGVRLVLVNACQSAQAGVSGLCQRLTSNCG